MCVEGADRVNAETKHLRSDKNLSLCSTMDISKDEQIQMYYYIRLFQSKPPKQNSR